MATLTYGGSNLVQSVVNSAGTITGPAPLTNAPDLAPLGNYGGPTQTMPPLPGSPAIGAGSVAANTFSTDQRGYPRTQNGLIDLGAVELQSPAANPPVLTMKVSGANFIVSWPTNYTGYILQQTVQLDNLNWVSLTLPFPPIITNGQFVFTVPAASLQPGFFRVRSP